MSSLSIPKVTKVERINPEKDYFHLTQVAGGNKAYAIPNGYKVDKNFANNGFYRGTSGVEVAAFVDTETGQRIVAVAGTNEMLDVQGWPSRGRQQWEDARRVVIPYINQSDEHVHMVGYSLGGGVVQQGVYEINANNPQEQITGTTFDAPGARGAIPNYQEGVVKTGQLENIVIHGSIVSGLPLAHVGNVTVIPSAADVNPSFYQRSVPVGEVPAMAHRPDAIDQSLDHQAIIQPYSHVEEPFPTFIEKLKGVLGSAGEGLLTVGHMALDTAMGIGKVGLESAFEVLSRNPQLPQNAKNLLQQNMAKVVMGQILGQMQATMQQQQRGGMWERPPTPFERNTTEQGKIEAAMNNPANGGFFAEVMVSVNKAVQNNGAQNPLEALLTGIISGMNDAAQTQKAQGGGWEKRPYISPAKISIMGHNVTVDGRVLGDILAGHPAVPQRGMPELGGVQYGGGDVHVHAYHRATGAVKDHTRTKPDGDVSNNLSYKTRG